MNHTKFATVQKATALLATEDSFTASWSQFDIDARLGKVGSTKKELLQFIGEQILPWTTSEKEKLQVVFNIISQKIKAKKLKIDFPEEIYFIKTTANEEGGAQGYTRANYIVVKDNIESMSAEKLQYFIAHELFHVLSRHNNEFRKSMYKIIGFKLMDAQQYPMAIKDKRITNPDATQTDCFIELDIKGKKQNCMMILYSDRAYTSGHFFEYLNVRFLTVSGKQKIEIAQDVKKSVVFKSEIFGQDEASNFFEQVGRNTKYIIHPEEIMADNFSYLIFDKPALPDPWITEAILKNLQ